MSVQTEPVEIEPTSGRPFKRADLERMPHDGRRYELIDGVLIVSAAPGRRPQEASLVAWELGPDKKYRQVAKAVGDTPFSATVPYPVTIIPADLVRDS